MAQEKKRDSGLGAPQRSSGERSETERSGGAPNPAPEPASIPAAPSPPDPEVLEKPLRRRFTAEYKLEILKAANGLTDPGQLGQLLRREGLYYSHLRDWRKQRDAGALSGLEPRKRGRKAKELNPLARKLAESEAKNRKLEKRLGQAAIIIEFQKKLADLLGIPLGKPPGLDEEIE